MSERIGTVPGTVIHEGRVENAHGLVAIMKGVTTGEVEVKTNGLVVAIVGGGNLPQGDPVCFEAQKLATGVATRGGVLVNGGENSGTMLAVTEVEPKITLGVVCPYHEPIHFGIKTVVNSYQTRKLILSVMPIVVVFQGQVGTLDDLIGCIGWIKSLQKQNTEPPKLWVHKYWWDVLDLLNSKGAIHEHVWDKIHRFTEVDEVLATL